MAPGGVCPTLPHNFCRVWLQGPPAMWAQSVKSFQTKPTPDILSSVHSSVFNALQSSLLPGDLTVKRKLAEPRCLWVGNAGVRKPSCHASVFSTAVPKPASSSSSHSNSRVPLATPYKLPGIHFLCMWDLSSMGAYWEGPATSCAKSSDKQKA